MASSKNFIDAKAFVKHLYNEFSNEARRGHTYNSLSDPLARVTKAMGKFLSVRSIKRYILNKTPEGRKHTNINKPKLDSFDKDFIKRTMIKMFLSKELLTLRKLKCIVQTDLELSISKTTLWRIVRKSGFTFRKRAGVSRRVLCERADLVSARSRYLRLVKQKREEGYDIKYLDETFVNEHHTKEKEWTSTDGMLGRIVPSSKGKRLIIAHVGGKDGFVPDTSLVFKSISTDNRDYHTEMNSEVFENWMKDTVLPAANKPSCFVMDNASYHNRVALEDKVPTMSWKKADIELWLQKNDIEFDRGSLKPELVSIVKAQNKKKIFAVDKMIAEMGHTSLRLPPYHADLNPIELIWAKIKNEVADKNTTFKLKDIMPLVHQAIDSTDKAYWAKCVNHVETQENMYWQNDGLNFHQPQIIINPNDSDSDVSLQSEGSDESEDDFQDNC